MFIIRDNRYNNVMSTIIDDNKMVEIYQQEKRLRALKWRLLFYPTGKDVGYTLVAIFITYFVIYLFDIESSLYYFSLFFSIFEFTLWAFAYAYTSVFQGMSMEENINKKLRTQEFVANINFSMLVLTAALVIITFLIYTFQS